VLGPGTASARGEGSGVIASAAPLAPALSQNKPGLGLPGAVSGRGRLRGFYGPEGEAGVTFYLREAMAFVTAPVIFWVDSGPF